MPVTVVCTKINLGWKGLRVAELLAAASVIAPKMNSTRIIPFL